MEGSYLDLKALVIENFVNTYDGVYDERPIDAARTMYEHGMSNADIHRAMVQVFNAGWDAAVWYDPDSEDE
jgi:hypothetical protein